MARRKWRATSRVLLAFGAVVLLGTVYLALAPIQEPCECRKQNPRQYVFVPLDNHGNFSNGLVETRKPGSAAGNQLLHKYDTLEWGRDRLAVVVPYRDRFEELLEFAPLLHQFLNRQKIRHKIFVVNQVDLLRFNRGSLINVGFLTSRAECNYMAMHDVDLIPMNPNISYAMPEKGPYHVSAPSLHPRYHYATFVGGILLLTNEHFTKVNGFSNRYFGWGKEDDEFYVRMRDAKLAIERPKSITTGYKTFKHIHDKQRRPRDNKRYFDQKTKSRLRDRITGLDTVLYVLQSRHDLDIEGAPITILNVELRCDLNATPWCVAMDTYQEIQEYLATKDQLVPQPVYSKASNGNYVKVNTTMVKPQPPVDLRYFINLKLDDSYSVR